MNKYRETEIVSAEVREITPAMASEMLAKNMGNRNLSPRKTNHYSGLMRSGSWKLTHQGIAVSAEGNIIDGQHRLSAVVSYGKPVKFLVTTLKAADDFGELTATGQPIDIGKLRSVSDITDEPKSYVTVVRTIIRDYLPNGQLLDQNPEFISSCIDVLRPSLDITLQQINRKGLSVATIRAIVALRYHTGVDVRELYRHSLNKHYNLLPNSWVSWVTRIDSLSEGKRAPRNGDFRKYVSAITWQVTDPNKDENQVIVARNTDRYIRDISDTAEKVFASVL